MVIEMIKYFKMKLFMMQLKLALYDALAHSEDYITLFTKLAIASKDMEPDEVKKEFLKEFTGIIHDYVHKTDEKSENKENAG